MIRVRPYKDTDADTILSWCKDEKSFYQWEYLGIIPLHIGNLALLNL